MTITRIQALIIAAGLVLVGVAVARAGHDTSQRRPDTGTGSVAQNYPLRDSHLHPIRPETPAGTKAERPFSRL